MSPQPKPSLQAGTRAVGWGWCPLAFRWTVSSTGRYWCRWWWLTQGRRRSPPPSHSRCTWRTSTTTSCGPPPRRSRRSPSRYVSILYCCHSYADDDASHKSTDLPAFITRTTELFFSFSELPFFIISISLILKDKITDSWALGLGTRAPLPSFFSVISSHHPFTSNMRCLLFKVLA